LGRKCRSYVLASKYGSGECVIGWKRVLVMYSVQMGKAIGMGHIRE
jgi:hypothetical protein